MRWKRLGSDAQGAAKALCEEQLNASVMLPAGAPIDGDSPVPSHFGTPHGVHGGCPELRFQCQQLLCQHLGIQSILHMSITTTQSHVKMLVGKVQTLHNPGFITAVHLQSSLYC